MIYIINIYFLIHFLILKINLVAHIELIEKLFNWLFSNNKIFILYFNSNNNFNLEQFDLILHSNKSSLDLLITCLLAIGLISFLLFQAQLLNISFYPNSTFDSEKYSPYECGFSPFKTERAQFDIKFYLVALLFLVFDVELMFLLPYCLSYYYLGFTGYVVFIIFFSILLIGFLVEWAAGMLIWKGEKILKTFSNETYTLINTNIHEWTAFHFMNLYVTHIDNKYINKRLHKYTWRFKTQRFNWFWFWRPYYSSAFFDKKNNFF